MKHKIIRWIFIMFAILFLYLFGYGGVYRLGDVFPTLSWACPILYYPVNYIRLHIDCIYDVTEFTYALCGGMRSIEERSKEIGFHREWYKLENLGGYYYTYKDGTKTGECIFYDNGKPMIVLVDTEKEFFFEIYYRSGDCAISRRNGIGKAFWSNKHMFAQWTFGDCLKPIDGFVPKISKENHLFLREYKNGELIHEYNDLSVFGGDQTLIDEYLTCVSPYL